jgi:hypothetical protein
MPERMTPEALAADIDKIADGYAGDGRQCADAGDRAGARIHSAIVTTYRTDAQRIRKLLGPPWAAMAAQLAELQREREQAIAGGWTADATRRVAEISADNAMLRGEAEALAEVREVIGAYESEELNPITAFGDIVKILRPDLDGGRHD